MINEKREMPRKQFPLFVYQFVTQSYLFTHLISQLTCGQFAFTVYVQCALAHMVASFTELP